MMATQKTRPGTQEIFLLQVRLNIFHPFELELLEDEGDVEDVFFEIVSCKIWGGGEPCTVSFLFYVLFCFILASDTQSSFSDYTSLSNDDHEGRYDHDAAAGIIFSFPSLVSHNLPNTIRTSCVKYFRIIYMG